MRILNFLTLNFFFVVFILFYFSTPLNSQKILSGPIQGHTTDTSATFWLLTKKTSSLFLSAESSVGLINSFSIQEDSIVSTNFKNKSAFKYTINFSSFNLGNINYYMGLGNMSQNEYSISLSSPNDSLFMFGSCAYIGTGYSRIYRPWNMTKIFKTMSNENTKNMLWMGDNVYLILNHDLKNTKRIYKRYIGVRRQKNMRKLLSASMQHYSTWDDHDFGPNNTDGSFKDANLTTAAFKSFWVNPVTDNKKGIYYSFKKGDASFLMTDSRTFKNNDGSTLLGEKQLNWLKNELLSSVSTFKIIILSNQLINCIQGHESYYDFEAERTDLISFINLNKIPGVLFLSGDRHHSEINIESDQNYYPIYDVTCSALSSPRPKFRGWGAEGGLSTRLENSFITKHNYGLLLIKSSNGEKSLIVRFMDKNRKKLFEHEIPMKTLGY